LRLSLLIRVWKPLPSRSANLWHRLSAADVDWRVMQVSGDQRSWSALFGSCCHYHGWRARTRASEPLAVRGGTLLIAPQTNGPLAVSGSMEVCAGTGRTVDRLRNARPCRCGGSRNKPFCDGTHARWLQSAIAPVVLWATPRPRPASVHGTAIKTSSSNRPSRPGSAQLKAKEFP
jgi:CDGSH-type Zn-finger protein